MRKKLETRFPASRIKKIMQNDEDVGKIALAVPLLVSKALELFLQDLCERMYDITVKRKLKTVNSSHLKLCVRSYKVYDFLEETVSNVPDTACYDLDGEDRSTKRRKAVGDEGNAYKESKRRKRETVHNHSKGLGQSQGWNHRRGPHGAEWDISDIKCEDVPDALELVEYGIGITDSNGNDTIAITRAPKRDFDLNLGPDENGFVETSSNPISVIMPTSSAVEADGMKHDEHNGWPLFTYIDKMAINPHQLAFMDDRINKKDYDQED